MTDKYVPIVQEAMLLDGLAANPEHPKAKAVMDKLGVDNKDVQMWGLARSNPNHSRSPEVKNKVLLKIADKKPVSDEQSVSFNERFIAKNLLDGNPDLVIPFLEKKGHDVRVEMETQNVPGSGSGFGLPRTVERPRFYVRDRETNQWGPIDPSKLDLAEFGKDILDVATAATTSAVTAGAAALGAPAGPGGSAALAGGASAGMEGIKQAVAKVLGAREDYSGEEIAKQGLVGGAAGLLPGGVVTKSTRMSVPVLGRIPLVPKIPLTIKAKPVTGFSQAGAKAALESEQESSALKRRARQ